MSCGLFQTRLGKLSFDLKFSFSVSFDFSFVSVEPDVTLTVVYKKPASIESLFNGIPFNSN